MKEALRAILAVVAIFVVLGLFGQDADDDQADIEFWCYGTGGADNPTGVFWQETARRFEQANPGVRVKVVADIPHNPYNVNDRSLSQIITSFSRSFVRLFHKPR